jgi:hypothetical protein
MVSSLFGTLCKISLVNSKTDSRSKILIPEIFFQEKETNLLQIKLRRVPFARTRDDRLLGPRVRQPPQDGGFGVFYPDHIHKQKALQIQENNSR